MIRLVRRWWTQSNPTLLLESQDDLLKSIVKASFQRKTFAGVNGVEFSKDGEEVSKQGLDTIILAHGFGSGLGFFYKNVDALLAHPSVGRVLLVDWLGMGGSQRPQCRRPIRGLTEFTTNWCDSRYSHSEAVDFFIEPFSEWMQNAVGDRHSNGNGKLVLVGHSLGGYLSARFVMANPDCIVDKLVLASPVGFPSKPESSIKGSQLPTSFRVIDALWSSNMTPQQLIRMMGATRGRRNTKRVLLGRIPHLKGNNAREEEEFNLLANYLYHITVADPSGEFAMNSILEPAVSADIAGVYAREPLERSFASSEIGSVGKLKSIEILFGDHDWMRFNEPSARRAVETLQRNLGIPGNVTIIPNAGHHLYLDNRQAFVQSILSEIS